MVRIRHPSPWGKIEFVQSDHVSYLVFPFFSRAPSIAFMWSRVEKRKRDHLVSWRLACKTKKEGSRCG